MSIGRCAKAKPSGTMNNTQTAFTGGDRQPSTAMVMECGTSLVHPSCCRTSQHSARGGGAPTKKPARMPGLHKNCASDGAFGGHVWAFNRSQNFTLPVWASVLGGGAHERTAPPGFGFFGVGHPLGHQSDFSAGG